MPTIEDILSKRQQIINLATQYKTHNVKLFGSVLRKEDTPENDIDFLVECQDYCSLFDIISLKLDLEEFLGRQVDIVTHDSLHWTLKDRILLEARPI